jgi:hypothetical protein
MNKFDIISGKAFNALQPLSPENTEEYKSPSLLPWIDALIHSQEAEANRAAQNAYRPAAPLIAQDAEERSSLAQVFSCAHKHNTYLHAGSGKLGWPHDHTVEDTYAYGPQEMAARAMDEARDAALLNEAHKAVHPVAVLPNDQEYSAEFGAHGEAYVVKRSTTYKFIAAFDTMADAQKAAKALNEHEGY